MQLKMNTDELMKVLNNTVEYSTGFVVTAKSAEAKFNRQLAELIVDMLYSYIDSQAQISPEKLHHVYEWGMVGNSSGRLFKFDITQTGASIKIAGQFLPSSSVSPTATEPFVNKADVMESGIDITIKPKSANVLAFEDDGELVFASQVHVVHPGGKEVAGGFKETVDNFFNYYVTQSLVAKILVDKKYAKEFVDYFSSGTKGGYVVGKTAAQKYMRVRESIDEL